MAPTVEERIGDKVQIHGRFSPEEAKRIAELIKSTPRSSQRFQTSDNVTTIACSANGKLIAVANGNPTFILQTSGTSRLKDNWKPSVEIFDAETGATVVALNLSTDGEKAVLATTPQISHSEVTALEFSHEGSLLAVGTSIGQVIMFDTRTGKPVGSLDDEKAKAADAETPESWWPLRRAIGSVQSLAFSPDGRLLAVCGSSFSDFSDVFDRIERGGLGRHASGPGRLKVFDVKTGAFKHDLAGHSHVFDVAFSSDGSLLASAGRWEDASGHGNGAIIWNPQTGEKIRTIQIEANGGTQYVAFSPNKKLIVTGSVQFDKENDTKSTSIAVTYPLSDITEWTQTVPGWSKPAFTSDGKSIAILCGSESIRLVNAETGQLQHEMKVIEALPGGKWNDFASLPDMPKLAIGGTDASGKGVVAIWQPDDSQ